MKSIKAIITLIVGTIILVSGLILNIYFENKVYCLLTIPGLVLICLAGYKEAEYEYFLEEENNG